MGGVAAACRHSGHVVAGSEPELYEPMASYLRREAVAVFPKFDPGNLESFDPDLVVVGNAVSRGNAELEWALEKRLNLISLPQMVGELLIGKHTSIVVTGTHGKTTTTSMAAWLLDCGGLAPGFLIGAVPGNFEVSCRAAEAPNAPFVIEGDEYDSAYWDKRSKFLHYRPDIAVINNLEFDHADIFESLSAIQSSFRLFARLIPRNGLLLVPEGCSNLEPVLRDPVSPIQTFGLEQRAHWRAVEIDSGPLGTAFTVLECDSIFGRVECAAVGEHNVRNMLAAVAIAARMGLDAATTAKGAATFRLPKRRMEELGTWREAVVIDDFGHHPTAIRETLAALKAKYPGKRLLAVFEPRSNTTTRSILQDEIRDAFDDADAVALGALDRPERYAGPERLDTASLVEHWSSAGKAAFSVTLEQGQDRNWGRHVLEFLRGVVRPHDVVVLFSNGNLGELREMLRSEELS